MWNVLEPWQLRQLSRMAAQDPERVEEMLNTLWASYPGLFKELALAALDQGEIERDRCADLLMEAEEQVERDLETYRRRPAVSDFAVVQDDARVARLAEGRVAVWEIVREFRKLGSVERLVDAFPALTRGELAAALSYAEKHPQEIEDQICRYEAALRQRRAEYPFAR
jgi:uncharacterized protein (DUF433 family)